MSGDFVNQLLNKFGYALMGKAQYQRLRGYANYKPRENVLAEHLRRVFNKHQVDCVFDVGANDGAYAHSLRREVGFEGLIISFEPIPKQVAVLKAAAAKDPKWIIRDHALASTCGECEFNVMSSDVFSSFLLPDSSQPQKYADSNCVTETLKVRMRTVAEVWQELKSEHGLKKLYLKMDTQGYDLEVFSGAATVLHDIPALQSELAFRPIYQDAPDIWKALEVYKKSGYVPSMLHGISFDETLAMIEADGVFVRSVA